MRLPISVTFITRNEEARIAAGIQSVQNFASEIIVVDSESTDRTVEISQSLGAKTFNRAFTGFGQQKNFAHAQCTQAWVLSLDADERVTFELERELRAFFSSAEAGTCAGIYLPRKTWYLNRWIMHGGWFPNYLLRLSRREKSRWTEPSLHEALQTEGPVQYFKQPLEHFSFPNQRSHILKNVEYAAMAERGLVQREKKTRLFDVTVRPAYKFFDMYLIKRGFMDGAAGFFIAVHSAYALFLRYAYLYEDMNGKNT